MTETQELQAIYARQGYFVIASREYLPPGPVERNDWNEDDMTQCRWSVIAEASSQDLIEQNAALGFFNNIDSFFRFFYRVIALD